MQKDRLFPQRKFLFYFAFSLSFFHFFIHLLTHNKLSPLIWFFTLSSKLKSTKIYNCSWSYILSISCSATSIITRIYSCINIFWWYISTYRSKRFIRSIKEFRNSNGKQTLYRFLKLEKYNLKNGWIFIHLFFLFL